MRSPFAMVAMAVLAGAAAVSQANSLGGPLSDNEAINHADGEIVSGADGVMGGVFYDNTSINTSPAASSVFARAIFGHADNPFGNLPAPGIKFAGILEFDIDTFVPGSAFTQPNTPHVWTADWSVELDSAQGGLSSTAFSTTLTATYNDIAAGWVGDGAGNYFWAATYNNNRGIFAWASTTDIGSQAWWTALNTPGDMNYNDTRANSAYITGGRFDVTASPVPTPAAAAAGLVLLSGLSLRRSRNA